MSGRGRPRSGVDMLAVIGPGPAVEGAGLDPGQVIGDEVAAELVAFVDDDEEVVAAGHEGEADRVAQARGEDGVAAARRIDRPDRGAALLLVHAMFGDVRIGADADIEPAVGAGGEALGPVMIALGGEPGDRARRRGDAGRGGIIGEGDQRVGIGDVERVADQRPCRRASSGR